jgi:pyridoxamine 5'-phosphate oxidase family protein
MSAPTRGAFTTRERAYLASGPTLARVATVDRDGNPHVVPTGWSYDEGTDTIILRGRDLERTKKYRDAQASGRIAVVIDHVDAPWRPVGIEIRGRAEIAGAPDAQIRVHPTRVISWGIESDRIGERVARDVSPTPVRDQAPADG